MRLVNFSGSFQHCGSASVYLNGTFLCGYFDTMVALKNILYGILQRVRNLGVPEGNHICVVVKGERQRDFALVRDMACYTGRLLGDGIPYHILRI